MDNINVWLLDATGIKPGYSAVLSGNYACFYTIHCTAITLISASVISCPIVVISILTRASKEKLDFSDRFPLYLAICDFLWGLPHLFDHLVLVVRQVYPDTTIATLLGTYTWFFLGYQQLMNAGLASYIYFKVVKTRYINLGRWEWKLHALCIGITLFSIAVFLPMGSFGNAGYWFLDDVTTTAGRALGFHIVIFATFQAVCTTYGYSAMKNEIYKQIEAMLSHQDKISSIGQHCRDLPRRHSTAIHCLTTFIRISVAIYCTTALGYWAFAIQTSLGVLEPFTILVIVIAANSSGWANAMGYFYNNKLKANRAASYSNNPLLTESTVPLGYE